VEDEIRFHIESRVADLVADGVEEAEARRRAQADFGDREWAARQVRRESTRGGTMTSVRRWMVDGARDAVLAVRQLRRNPGFAAAALLTLALGVGGTTAVFTVVDGVLFRPLPFPDEARVARIWPAAPSAGEAGRRAWSVPDLDDWRERAASLTALGAYTTTLGGLVVPGDGPPEDVPTAYVTGGFFEALGTPAQIGTPLPAAAEFDDPRVVVLSDRYWRRRFAANPGVVGTTLNTEDGAFRIVGVMPQDFAFPTEDTAIWTFLTNVAQESVPWRVRQVRVFEAVARLAPGIDPAAAVSDLEGVASQLALDLPESNGGLTGVEWLPIREAIIGEVRLPLLLLAGAVGLTLLIACVNVASLLLARGAARARDFGLRAALGAGQGRLARQVLAESLLLGLVGGALGLLVSTVLVRALVAGAGSLLPRSGSVALDERVVIFALVASLSTGVLFGLLPALRAGGRKGTALPGQGRGTAAAGDARGLLDVLVFAEVTLAVVLLVGGGLLMRSFAELRNVDPGFDVAGLLVADVVLSDARYGAGSEYLTFRDRLLERLNSLPGVVGASTAKQFPTRGMGETWGWSRPGEPPARPGEEHRATAMHVHRDFFEVMRIPVVRGTAPGDNVALSLVINERLAREAFGGPEAAVGSMLIISGNEVPVSAVVGDVVQSDPATQPPPMIYLDDRISGRRVFSFVIRTQGDPLALAEPFRRVLTELDPDQAVRSIYTGQAAYGDAVAQPRFFAFLMGLFAAGAMVLAAVGIYGVIAYSVRRRTREIGVRVALGADRGRLRWMVVSEALKPVVPGVLLGLAAAGALSVLMTHLLYGVRRFDPATYVTVGAMLVGVAVLASWAPAREATRVSPLDALRTE
jgi:predicted permease